MDDGQGTQAESHPQRPQLQVGLLLESVGGVSVVEQPYADVLSTLKNGTCAATQYLQLVLWVCSLLLFDSIIAARTVLLCCR